MIIPMRLFASCLEINISRRKANYVNASLPLLLLEPHLSHYLFSIGSHQNIIEMNRYDRFIKKCPEQTKDWISTLETVLTVFLLSFHETHSCLQSIPLFWESTEQPPYSSSCMAESYIQGPLLSDTYLERDTYTCIYVHTHTHRG